MIVLGKLVQDRIQKQKLQLTKESKILIKCLMLIMFPLTRILLQTSPSFVFFYAVIKMTIK